MNARKYFPTAAAFALIFSTGLALAAPIAPRVPVTKSGKAINYGCKGVCPDEMVFGGSDVGEERNVFQRLLGE